MAKYSERANHCEAPSGCIILALIPRCQVLERRRARRIGEDPRVFRRDGVPVRVWRCALRDACRQAKVPHRLLHDCRRTAARNLIRAGVPERVAMILTGHKTRSVFDRYNIVNERELFSAGERLVTYLSGQRSPERTPITTRRRGPDPRVVLRTGRMTIEAPETWNITRSDQR